MGAGTRRLTSPDDPTGIPVGDELQTLPPGAGGRDTSTREEGVKLPKIPMLRELSNDTNNAASGAEWAWAGAPAQTHRKP
ncbi:hypothetical protein JCM14467A_10000 [Vulcanisaeta sp. JCM 14467]